MIRFDKGQILVLGKAEFPKHAIVVDGYNDDGHLLAHALGGGFQQSFPPSIHAQFRVVDEHEQTRQLHSRARFSLMDSDELFSGWTDGSSWNGWAVPYFERLEAERLIRWLNDERSRFDEQRKAFLTWSADGEEELWEATEIRISDGTTVHAYSIGGGSWCWDEVE